MVRESSFGNVAACCAVSNPAWCRIGTLFQLCVFGQSTSPSNDSLDAGVNEHLAGCRFQCVAYNKYIASK